MNKLVRPFLFFLLISSAKAALFSVGGEAFYNGDTVRITKLRANGRADLVNLHTGEYESARVDELHSSAITRRGYSVNEEAFHRAGRSTETARILAIHPSNGMATILYTGLGETAVVPLSQVYSAAHRTKRVNVGAEGSHGGESVRVTGVHPSNGMVAVLYTGLGEYGIVSESSIRGLRGGKVNLPVFAIEATPKPKPAPALVKLQTAPKIEVVRRVTFEP